MKRDSTLPLFLILSLASAKLFNAKQVQKDHLPTYVNPSHYSLDLVLDPKATTYNGSVQINFSAPTALRDVIELHASPKTIKILSTLLNYNHNCPVTEHDNDTEIVTFTCPVRSFQTENTFVIHFQGTISTEILRGLFKTTYEEDGDEHVLLATLFEPVHARQAFPCFDEPRWKATFDIFITHPDDYIALANTPAIKQFSVAPNQIQTQFKTTPPMSVYLIAFVISKFVSNHDKQVKGYDYNVFTRPSGKGFTSVAATYGPTLIDLLSNWTGIAYEDLGVAQAYQVAIPNFDDGAMENWGLITFGEVDLLDEKDITSNSAKQSVISILAHELAHQWFGDYVTLNWWSDTWLNEGFATYFEYYIPDQLEDKLEMMMQFVVKELQPVLETDILPSALPLSSDANSEEEIDAKFNEISYSKGASIIRMLIHVIGENNFKEGVQSYLSTYKYNNTDPTLLLNSFKVETPLALDRIMYNWIYKIGYPLITAKLNGSTVTVTQDRFAIYNMNNSEDLQWYVPITYTTRTENNFNVNVKDWLDPNSTVDIKLDSNSWIILNIQQTGYCRVNYDDTLWQRIIDDLKKNRNNIHVLNRAQLVNDVFNIARTGKVSYKTAFHLANYLRCETEYYPWVSAFDALAFISGRLGDEEAESLLQSRILYWLNKAFPSKSTNFGSSHVDKLKEVLILYWACKLGEEGCIVYANNTFQKYKNSYSLPDNNKRGIVFCYGYLNSSNPVKDYDFLISLYRNSSVRQQNEIISSLGCTKNTDLLLRYLSETITENSPIRKKDAALVFDAVYTKTEVGVNVSLTFLEDNLEKVITKFKEVEILSNLMLGLAKKVTSDNQIKRISKIFNQCSDIEAVQAIRNDFIATITTNKIWTNKYAAEIKSVLEEPIIDSGHILQPTYLLIFSQIIYLLYNRRSL